MQWREKEARLWNKSCYLDVWLVNAWKLPLDLERQFLRSRLMEAGGLQSEHARLASKIQF